MKKIYFLIWFLVSLFTTVKGLENPTPTINWKNSSPNNAHQSKSLANGWFKYPSGHWGRKFHYGCQSTPPPAKPLLVWPHTLFYLLTYMVGYYLLGRFSSLMGRFAYLGHLGYLAMVTVPIGSAIAGLSLGALAHQIGDLFPLKWVPDTQLLGLLDKAMQGLGVGSTGRKFGIRGLTLSSGFKFSYGFPYLSFKGRQDLNQRTRWSHFHGSYSIIEVVLNLTQIIS
ncbi:hypothetical protein DSO57_1008034 [Entomophthora muscae]|uniref:Uncharacterized protein n=1 Tax=Entomophthora muscae TaxID=34485 RepID=A0ACC2UTW7_9FUNG|nr:hypothetical protein DSO57_1008034 [Entomophthora muscae]